MAKKKKPVDAEFSTIDMAGDKPVANAVQADPEATTAEKMAAASCGTVDDEAMAKLEQFDKLQQAVADLTSENEALKDKLAEYVQKLRDAQTPGENVEDLRNQNDQYLMRISELTFENAKMQSQLDNLQKQAKQRETKPQRETYASNVYRSAAMNGYSSWN